MQLLASLGSSWSAQRVESRAARCVPLITCGRAGQLPAAHRASRAAPAGLTPPHSLPTLACRRSGGLTAVSRRYTAAWTVQQRSSGRPSDTIHQLRATGNQQDPVCEGEAWEGVEKPGKRAAATWIASVQTLAAGPWSPPATVDTRV